MKLAHSASRRLLDRAKANAQESGGSVRRRLDFEKMDKKTVEGQDDEGKGGEKGEKKKRQAPDVTDTGPNHIHAPIF